MKKNAFIGLLVIILVFCLIGCDNDNKKTEATGTFQIRITGFPDSIMSTLENNYFNCSLYKGNEFSAALYPKNYEVSYTNNNQWISFYMYKVIPYLNGWQHINDLYYGTAGSYNLRISLFDPITGKNVMYVYIPSVRLEIDQLNILEYNSFQQ